LIVALLGTLMVAVPDGVATAAHTLRISAPAPDRTGRVAGATRRIGVILLVIAVVLLALALF